MVLINKYENITADFGLTFTQTDYHLGKLITKELLDLGEFIKVTNENK